MLTVPATIQSLFKDDGVLKNFRVHFPNGENADLTNSDIVSGSVRFTESVCSKDVLQFGLAEASRIEFECVNVQNIYGMVIECGIEVDTSSLSAAQITAIQSDPGDGTLVLVGDSDIGYGFYRVPYGVFTVTSCPRSAGAMWRRKVEAYSNDASTLRMSRLLKPKLGSYYSNMDAMTQNVPMLLAQEMNSIADLSTSETTVSMTYRSLTRGGTYYTWDYSGDTYSVIVPSVSGTSYAYDCGNEKALFRFTCTADTTVIDSIYADLKTYGIPDKLLDKVKDTVQPSAMFNYPTFGATQWCHFENIEDSGYVYLFDGTTTFVTMMTYPDLSYMPVTLYKNGASFQSYAITPYITNPVLKKITLTDANSQLLNITLKQTSDVARGMSFINSLPLSSLAVGFAELNAKFIRFDRFNSIEQITLSKSSPISVNTTEYSDLWWDEYDIAPIGSATITYFDVDQNAEQTIVYDFGNGASEYDMTDNYLLKNLAVSVNDLTNQTVEEFVTGLLDTYFIPNISDIAFTPVQLDALGLPYLEAGDYLEIDDGNSGTVGTYIMNRTISGEQFLEDEIESQGGEIIGNARSA